MKSLDQRAEEAAAWLWGGAAGVLLATMFIWWEALIGLTVTWLLQGIYWSCRDSRGAPSFRVP